MFDVIVVGSGPAGVSASYPLVSSGMRVLMVDGGRENTVLPPAGPYLAERERVGDQLQWMVGREYHALRNAAAVSPKLRVPTQIETFSGFAAENRIVGDKFAVMGSLARGGLSNAWGCGVAALDSCELEAFHIDRDDMRTSYETITRRIGVSGAAADDLREYFGVDDWAQEPIPLDNLHKALARRYVSARNRLRESGFTLGRSRVAALSARLGTRQPCDLSGTCLWGCARGSLYTATQDLAELKKAENFTYQPGFVVEQIETHGTDNAIVGHRDGIAQSLKAPTIVLAAGTLASTAIVMRSLGMHGPLRIQSSPTAAFLLWMPRFLGAGRTAGFGLGQLSFSLQLDNDTSAFGSTFSSTGLPVAEFLRHLPIGRRAGADVLRNLLGSCLVGNTFFPGELSDHRATLNTDGSMHIRGGFSASFDGALEDAHARLKRSFRQLGAWLLPGSFTRSIAGADIHYACSLPMKSDPDRGECATTGELVGANGVYIVDGASLSALSAKSHTLTIMANADRIARGIAKRAVAGT